MVAYDVIYLIYFHYLFIFTGEFIHFYYTSVYRLSIGSKFEASLVTILIFIWPEPSSWLDRPRTTVLDDWFPNVYHIYMYVCRFCRKDFDLAHGSHQMHLKKMNIIYLQAVGYDKSVHKYTTDSLYFVDFFFLYFKKKIEETYPLLLIRLDNTTVPCVYSVINLPGAPKKWKRTARRMGKK